MSLKRKYNSLSSDCSESDDSIRQYGSERKRKRGEIEKKRRDKINEYLDEIKDLVPSALEKSTVNKLEKAEILQMAVEHLKTLQNYPEKSRSMVEYQNTGFRECMGEVSRYLVAVEGMHHEDPLRLRLMSHLHASSAATSGPLPQTWLGHPYHQYEDHQQRDRSYLQPATTRVGYSLPCYRPWGPDTGILY